MKNTLSLKDPKAFQKAINKGTWFGGNLISTYILSNSNGNTDVNFIGLAVGKKAGKATKRNRVKRVIRAVYSNLESQINTNGKIFLFVWRAKADFNDLSYDEIKRDIERAFKKAGILK